MEIVDVIETVKKYIPSEYYGLSECIAYAIPIIFFICALITVFAGYRFHKFWARLTMTVVSFIIVALTSAFFPNININIFIILAFIIAILVAYFSKHLYKVQVFIINFLTTYIFLPNILSKLIPYEYSILISLVLAIIVGIYSIKYKYIVTIITTSITGSMLVFNQIFVLLNLDKNSHIIVFYILVTILALLGGAFQFKFSGHNDISKKNIRSYKKMIKIVEYKNEYAKEISEIVLSNMYQINIKDHGKDVIDRISKNFTEDEIKKNFPNRTKCLVALKDNEVVGTASIDKYWGDETGEKYIILTLFVKIQNHHQGIGRKLMEEIENIANNIGCKELIIHASVYACEFYRKFGFDYLDSKKTQNEDKEYILIKKY